MVTTWTADCLQTGKTSLYTTNHPGQFNPPSLCVAGVGVHSLRVQVPVSYPVSQ